MKELGMKVYWSRPKMTKPTDSLESSKFTWSDPVNFESQGPPDMHLVIQHFYGRAWHIAKRTFDEEAVTTAHLEKAFIERQCVHKAKIRRQKDAINQTVEKPRYIYPKFRNIAPRINTNLRRSSQETSKPDKNDHCLG